MSGSSVHSVRHAPGLSLLPPDCHSFPSIPRCQSCPIFARCNAEGDRGREEDERAIEGADMMHRPRVLLSIALSLHRPHSSPHLRALVSTTSLLQTLDRDPSAQTLAPSSSPLPPARTVADLRRRLAAESPSLSDFIYSVEVGTKKKPLPKPKWMKETIPGGAKYAAIKAKLRELKLHTVCEEARCPNLGECWSGGETGTATATIMILGDTCTRGCRWNFLEFYLFPHLFPCGFFFSWLDLAVFSHYTRP